MASGTSPFSKLKLKTEISAYKMHGVVSTVPFLWQLNYFVKIFHLQEWPGKTSFFTWWNKLYKMILCRFKARGFLSKYWIEAHFHVAISTMVNINEAVSIIWAAGPFVLASYCFKSVVVWQELSMATHFVKDIIGNWFSFHVGTKCCQHSKKILVHLFSFKYNILNHRCIF